MTEVVVESPSNQSLAQGLEHRWTVLGLYAVAALVFLILFLFRLDIYPTPWFDEGAYLNVARTYADEGIYAETSSDGYRWNGAVVSTGPTVILPVAVVFKLVEPSFQAARLVMVLYALLTFVALYALSKNLIDKRFAIVVVLLALFGWGNRMPLIYRTVTGEGPAMFFVFTGLWLWLKPGKRSSLSLGIVGVLMGLAALTKNQIALFVLPSLLLAFMLELVYYKQRGWLYFVIPGIIAGVFYFGWTYYSLYMLGSDLRDPSADLEALQETGTNSYFVLDLQQNMDNLFDLTSGLAFGGFFLAGLLVGLILAFRRDEDGQRWGILSAFLVTSLGLYLLTGATLVEANRSAIPMYLIGALFVARLFYTLTDGYTFDWNAFRDSVFKKKELNAATIIQIIALTAVLGIIVLPASRALYNVARSGDDAPYQVADFLDQNAASGAVIETWDKEIGILTEHVYHYPPQIVQAYHNAYIRGNGPPANQKYDFHDHITPDFIVIGPQSRWADFYPTERLDAFELVATFGDYEIYQRHKLFGG